MSPDHARQKCHDVQERAKSTCSVDTDGSLRGVMRTSSICLDDWIRFDFFGMSALQTVLCC